MLVLMPQKDSSLFPVIILDIYMSTDKIAMEKAIPTWMIPSVKPPLPSGVHTAFLGSYGFARSFLNGICQRRTEYNLPPGGIADHKVGERI